MDTPPNQAILAALHEINAAVLMAAQPGLAPLQIVAHHARDLTASDLATIAVPGDDPSTLVLRVAEGVNADYLRGLTFPIEASISGEVFTTGRAVMVADAADDPRVHQPVVELGEIGPLVLAPLFTNGAPIGTLAVARTRSRPQFTVHERDLVAAFASQASVVIRLARNEHQLLTLTDAERRERLGRQLHDTVMQRLYGISVSFQALLATTLHASAPHIERLIDELDATIDEIRSTIFEQPH